MITQTFGYSKILSVALAFLCLTFALAARAQAGSRVRLNDTGETQCLTSYGGALTDQCSGTGQDAGMGRDVTHADDHDGHAGFSFVKISANGAELPPSAMAWSCVKDKITGLMWEIKTADGGLRDMNNGYTNLGYSNLVHDASHFVAAVNAQGLCGYNDWRLPMRLELESIVDYSGADGKGPAIDSDWFPNTIGILRGGGYWTQNANGDTQFPAYSWVVFFLDGKPDLAYQGNTSFVRLVRSNHSRSKGGLDDAAAVDRYRANGAEVTDALTGLIWRRCSEGQTWTGTTCAGKILWLTWQQALDLAKSQPGWRLPNVKELSSLVDTKRFDPAIETRVFPKTASYEYWSSSYLLWNFAQNPTYPWVVNFGDGSFEYGTLGVSEVRLVRDK